MTPSTVPTALEQAAKIAETLAIGKAAARNSGLDAALALKNRTIPPNLSTVFGVEWLIGYDTGYLAVEQQAIAYKNHSRPTGLERGFSTLRVSST